jgi:hypothetical protein|tara:strand:- start:30 stop:209 length:180 start_codon:yes stop_codon:yes gene_type:complete
MDEMNITSAQYAQVNGVNESITVVIDGVTMSVPLAPGNRHYDEIQRQVAAGTLTIQDAD